VSLAIPVETIYGKSRKRLYICDLPTTAKTNTLISRVPLIIARSRPGASAAPQTKHAYELVYGVKQNPDHRFKITTDRQASPSTMLVEESHLHALRDAQRPVHRNGKKPNEHHQRWSASGLAGRKGHALKNGQQSFPDHWTSRAFSSALSRPVTALGAKAGAAIDPLEIKPSMPAPGDFDLLLGHAECLL